MVKDIFLSIKSIKGMKQLALILCMLFIFNSYLMGQEQLTENIPKDISDCLTKVGKDTLSTLNLCESKYLNCRFQKNKGTVDFCGKKVAFFKGNTGMIQSTKKDFFDKEKDFINIKGFLPLGSGQLIVFNENEARQVGYNAVIVVASKKYLTKKEILCRLKRKLNR